jgi:hypothetical protein
MGIEISTLILCVDDSYLVPVITKAISQQQGRIGLSASASTLQSDSDLCLRAI